MSLNYYEQEPGGINKDSDGTDDQDSKAFFKNTNVTVADADSDMGLNNYAISKHINVITVT